MFSDVTLTIKRGEKVAFVGKNGAGKSTLVKCIMGEIPYEGELKIGHNVKIGYFAQNQAQLLDESITVFDTIDRVAVGDIRTRINDLLGAFMFGGKASEKKVKVLSGGEKSRLAMIKLLLEPVNLLILDEPTNHLDMRTKDILKQAITDFDGTVIVVSHDRDFLDGMVQKVYEFGDHRVREHLCGIWEFLEKKQLDSLQQMEVNDKIREQKTENTPSTGRLNYEEQKERERKVKQAQKRVKQLEEKIQQLEQDIAAIEEKLSQGQTDDPGIYDRHAALQHDLDQTLIDWEEASMALEN